TADFLSSLIGSLPAMHDLAGQAGIELPQVLGRLQDGAVKDGRSTEPKTDAKMPVISTGDDLKRDAKTT
ncbi:MAG: hypothetical protein ACYTEI_05430, partial [Planctomycetota bacterium]